MDFQEIEVLGMILILSHWKIVTKFENPYFCNLFYWFLVKFSDRKQYNNDFTHIRFWKKMLNSSIETTQSKKATHCMFIISENTKKNYYLPKTNIVFHTLCSARNSKKLCRKFKSIKPFLRPDWAGKCSQMGLNGSAI